MKSTLLSLALAATVTVAQPHNHGGHNRLHRKRGEGSPVQQRDLDTEIVAATVTVYQMAGHTVSPEDAQACIKDGSCVTIGESTPTLTTPTSSAAPTTTALATHAAADEDLAGAGFLEIGVSIGDSSATSSTEAAATTTAEAATTTSAAAAATSSSSSSSSSSGTGVDAEFPDGELDCSTFPSDYGAVAVEWLGTGGWTSLQQTPNYSIGDLSISYIVSGVSGDNCQANGFCSYACPEGYVKSQWPSAQGSTGQSIGGLYCNSNGKLEMTRTEYKTLCQKGVGGVQIQNNLDETVSVCRTDYPGLENMVDPLAVEAGGTYSLANVASAEYYTWEGKSTTLQYYVNPKGLEPSKACVWTAESPYSKSAGNWAPTNIGVGQDSTGATYLSIFPNTPTSTATLDFDIKITGDYEGDCYLSDGSYAGSDDGCTITIPEGSTATLVFH